LKEENKKNFVLLKSPIFITDKKHQKILSLLLPHEIEMFTCYTLFEAETVPIFELHQIQKNNCNFAIQ